MGGSTSSFTWVDHFYNQVSFEFTQHRIRSTNRERLRGRRGLTRHGYSVKQVFPGDGVQMDEIRLNVVEAGRFVAKGLDHAVDHVDGWREQQAHGLRPDAAVPRLVIEVQTREEHGAGSRLGSLQVVEQLRDGLDDGVRRRRRGANVAAVRHPVLVHLAEFDGCLDVAFEVCPVVQTKNKDEFLNGL